MSGKPVSLARVTIVLSVRICMLVGLVYLTTLPAFPIEFSVLMAVLFGIMMPEVAKDV